MSATGIQTDREKSPLMKALYEVAMAHDVVLVVVSFRPSDGQQVVAFVDKRDDTPLAEAAHAFGQAAVSLLVGVEKLNAAAKTVGAA